MTSKSLVWWFGYDNSDINAFNYIAANLIIEAAILIAVYAGCFGLAWFARRASRGNWNVRPWMLFGSAVTVFLIQDVLAIGHSLYVCSTEGGRRIFRTVENVEGFLYRSDRPLSSVTPLISHTPLVRGGYRFVELEIVDPQQGGKVTSKFRYELVNRSSGECHTEIDRAWPQVPINPALCIKQTDVSQFRAAFAATTIIPRRGIRSEQKLSSARSRNFQVRHSSQVKSKFPSSPEFWRAPFRTRNSLCAPGLPPNA